MADIINLIEADHRHIFQWAARLGELRRHGGAGPYGPLLKTWQTLASLLELHMGAEDEICTPAIFGASPEGRKLARRARDDREEVREIIVEASLHPPGSPQWWDLATAVMAAWTGQLGQERHGPVADHRRRADPRLRRRLTVAWRAFTDAQIRDWYPQAPPQVPVHRLRQDEHAPLTVPRLASPAFGPLACICQLCNERIDQALRA